MYRCRLVQSHSGRKPGSTSRPLGMLSGGSRLSPGMRFFGLPAAAFLIPLLASVSSARAETAEVRLVRPLDLVALPLLVMEHEHLIERTAEAMGLGTVTVTWSAPGSPDPIQ